MRSKPFCWYAVKRSSNARRQAFAAGWQFGERTCAYAVRPESLAAARMAADTPAGPGRAEPVD